MKLRILLISLFVITTSSIAAETKTLEQWYQDVTDKMKTIKWGHPLFQYSRGFNHWNIKQKINFAQNKNKNLNFTQAMILIYRSGLDDLDISRRNNFWTFLIENLIEFNKRTIDVNYLECFRKELKKINPESPLVAGFDAFRMTMRSEDCDKIVESRGFDDYVNNFENTYGNLIEITDGALSKDKFKRFLITFVVLADETDLNRSREIIYLIEEFKNILDTAFNHIMNSLGNDDT
ncbi:unnamed protein product [Chironomus riparius]|uniref:Uncharacterized protein n=1 Tax=Chironomus riparius TaxID=315576 RepID=A0A9N9WYM9_9DIPT|nr:unnamed protein product [Chironomus riparius]